MLNSSNRIAANSLGLGLSCFAITVFLFSGSLWGILDTASPTWTLFFVGGLGMFVAGIIAYQQKDVFTATWLAAYGVFWPSVGFYFWSLASKSTNPTADLSWLAFAWGIFTAYMTILSLRSKSLIISLALLLFFIMFLFMWIASAFHVSSLDRVASLAGIITAILAAIGAIMHLKGANSTEAVS